MPKPREEFTTKQKRFIECYNGNAIEAAREAGYSERSVTKIGYQLMSNPKIAAAIRARENARNDDAIATREERQRFFTRVMRDEEQHMKDRLRASELLGKSEGDFIDRQELSGKDGTPLTVKGVLDEIRIRVVDAIQDGDGMTINPDTRPQEYAAQWLKDFYSSHADKIGQSWPEFCNRLAAIGLPLREV